MKEPPTDREELIKEIETYAVWCEKVITCRNRMQAADPQKFMSEPFVAFKEDPQCNPVYILVFTLFIITYFADVWWSWNLYPNGFFKGILLIVVVSVVLFVLYCMSETPEDPKKRELRYAEWEKQKKEHDEKEVAKYNDTLSRYNIEKSTA